MRCGATHRIPGLGQPAMKLLELMQCMKGLMQAVSTLDFLSVLDHHTGLKQSFVQGFL